jgi:hypothetical protein
MTFREVERVLGFRLPESARQHRPWWSNNVSTHVNAAAWREAGWRTARVDMGGEKVTFVREQAVSDLEEAGAPALWDDVIAVPISGVSKAALRLIDDYAEEAGCDRAEAVAAILDGCARDRRRRLLESFSSPTRSDFDSVSAIREDRDAR